MRFSRGTVVSILQIIRLLDCRDDIVLIKDFMTIYYQAMTNTNSKQSNHFFFCCCVVELSYKQ